jgi:hypothetical protein
MVRSKQTSAPAGDKKLATKKKDHSDVTKAARRVHKAARKAEKEARREARRQRKKAKKDQKEPDEEEDEEGEGEEEEEEEEQYDDDEEEEEENVGDGALQKGKRGRRMKPGKRALIEVKNAQKYSKKSSQLVFKHVPLRQRIKEKMAKLDTQLRIQDNVVRIVGMMLQNRLLKIYSRGGFMTLYVAKKRTFTSKVFNISAKMELDPHEMPTAPKWIDADPYAAA